MLSTYAKTECTTIALIGAMLCAAVTLLGYWWLAIVIVMVAGACLLFFRDPDRKPPSQRGVMVAPADGRVSSIHQVQRFEPFDGPATCVRIFLSVLDVHINRSPCHGEVGSITYKPGEYKNALNPDSAESNTSNLIVIVHPNRRTPVAAVRQVAGLLARTIHCAVRENEVIQRGQRIGMIKLGSTTELYIPASAHPHLLVEVGQMVKAGQTGLARVGLAEDAAEEIQPTTPQTVGA